MKCIIVDDEPLAIDLLVSYASQINELEIVATTTNPIEAVSLLNEYKVDLVLLDIEMPNLSGLELVRSIPNLPKFILTTAYPRYALDGFDLNATDYLVKPISLPRFIKAIGRAADLHKMQPEGGTTNTSNDFIFVKSEYENVRINTGEVTHIMGYKDYIKIYLEGSAKAVLTLMNFKSILEKLPAEKFLRIHRSCIVNIDFVVSHQKSKVKVAGNYLPVGETYKEHLLQRLGI